MNFEPDVIFLHDPYGYFEEEYDNNDNTVQWSEDRIDDNDYEYVRFKKLNEHNFMLSKVITEIEEQSSDLGESYLTIDKDNLRDILGNYFV